MSHPVPPKPPAPEDGFEFELTDFATARAALDNESIAVAASSARPAETVDWKTVRRARVATDRALTGDAIEWLLQLPAPLRPQKLSEMQPRIANAIAEAWHEPLRCISLIDGFVSDQRGGRRGLPYVVRQELQALRQDLAERSV